MRIEDQSIAYAIDLLLGEENQWRYSRPDWFCYQSPESLPTECRLCVVPCGFFGPAYGSKQLLPSMPLNQFEGVPILFGEPRVERSGDCLVLHADFLATSTDGFPAGNRCRFGPVSCKGRSLRNMRNFCESSPPRPAWRFPPRNESFPFY